MPEGRLNREKLHKKGRIGGPRGAGALPWRAPHSLLQIFTTTVAFFKNWHFQAITDEEKLQKFINVMPKIHIGIPNFKICNCDIRTYFIIQSKGLTYENHSPKNVVFGSFTALFMSRQTLVWRWKPFHTIYEMTSIKNTRHRQHQSLHDHQDAIFHFVSRRVIRGVEIKTASRGCHG